MYGFEIFHVVILTGVAYILMAVLKRDTQQHFVTIWVFSLLSYEHWDAYINRFMVYDMRI